MGFVQTRARGEGYLGTGLGPFAGELLVAQKDGKDLKAVR